MTTHLEMTLKNHFRLRAALVLLCAIMAPSFSPAAKADSAPFTVDSPWTEIVSPGDNYATLSTVCDESGAKTLILLGETIAHTRNVSMQTVQGHCQQGKPSTIALNGSWLKLHSNYGHAWAAQYCIDGEPFLVGLSWQIANGTGVALQALSGTCPGGQASLKLKSAWMRLETNHMEGFEINALQTQSGQTVPVTLIPLSAGGTAINFAASAGAGQKNP